VRGISKPTPNKAGGLETAIAPDIHNEATHCPNHDHGNERRIVSIWNENQRQCNARALMETIANEARRPTNAYPTDAEATYDKDD
jgi:hypothetical protein